MKQTTKINVLLMGAGTLAVAAFLSAPAHADFYCGPDAHLSFEYGRCVPDAWGDYGRGRGGHGHSHGHGGTR